MANRDDSIIEIKPVAGEVLPAVTLGSSMTSLIEALNPLGAIGKAIAEVLAYRTATKKLDLERERIRIQARVIDDAVQARLAYELRQFELQRQALLACLNHAEAVLCERRATRNALIRSLDNLNRDMSTLVRRKDIPIEIFGMYRDSLGVISNRLVEIERAGTTEVTALSQELHLIVGDVRRELEGMPPINKLLPPSR